MSDEINTQNYADKLHSMVWISLGCGIKANCMIDEESMEIWIEEGADKFNFDSYHLTLLCLYILKTRNVFWFKFSTLMCLERTVCRRFKANYLREKTCPLKRMPSIRKRETIYGIIARIWTSLEKKTLELIETLKHCNACQNIQTLKILNDGCVNIYKM